MELVAAHMHTRHPSQHACPQWRVSSCMGLSEAAAGWPTLATWLKGGRALVEAYQPQ